MFMRQSNEFDGKIPFALNIGMSSDCERDEEHVREGWLEEGLGV